MKKTIFTFFLGISLISCDNRIEAVDGFNISPEITFLHNNKEVTIYQDSLKKSSLGQPYVPIFLNFFDENNNIKDIKILKSSDDISLFYKNSRLTNLVPAQNGAIDLQYFSKKEGLSWAKFSITDRLGVSKEIKVSVFSFFNLAPVAVLKAQPWGIASKKEVILDASKSYDADARFGGGINKYIYTINAEVFETNTDTFKYIFTDIGTYAVSLQVIDNEGLASSPVRDEIILKN